MFEDLLVWLSRSVKGLNYGEIIITVKVHDGRPTIVEKTKIEREKPVKTFSQDKYI